MKLKLKKIKLLKEYFKKNPQVLMAFVFGSQSRGTQMKESDWDIGVYFKPKEYLEMESQVEEYEGEKNMWSDLIDILETDDVDFVVLNRARPVIVYTALRDGIPLIIRDQLLYLRLLNKTSYEAIDWHRLVDTYYDIFKQARSFTPETKCYVKERLTFLQEQLEDLDKFKKFTWEIYDKDKDQRRNIERWVENVVMASIDIAQAFLASEKRRIPQSYSDILKLFVAIHLGKDTALKFAEFAKLRNIVAHEYLDITWAKIKNFISEADRIYPKFIEKIEALLKKD